MTNLNSVLVEGNLTHDPESITTASGSLLCKFTLATNRYYKVNQVPQEEVNFFQIEIWGDRASACMNYLKKGREVRVIGRLKQERWEAGDGTKRERVVIVAEHVEFGRHGRKARETEDEAASAEA